MWQEWSFRFIEARFISAGHCDCPSVLPCSRNRVPLWCLAFPRDHLINGLPIGHDSHSARDSVWRRGASEGKWQEGSEIVYHHRPKEIVSGSSGGKVKVILEDSERAIIVRVIGSRFIC